MDEDILEGVRRVIYRWVNNPIPITADIAQGESLLSVRSTNRFLAGDEIALFDPDSRLGEPFLIVDKVIDETTLRLRTPVQSRGGFGPGQSSKAIKTWMGKFVQGMYIGDPDVIPKYPAISIMGQSKDSNWEALGLTKEDYKFQVAIYVEDNNTEDSYRQLLRLTKAVEKGLKKNIYPLIGDYFVSNVTADIAVSDEFIKVADTSDFVVDQIIVLETIHRAEELRIKCVVDSETIQVYIPPANPYLVADDAKVIALTRFIYNSWPAHIDYGFVHKGSLLHAATISWFAWEAEPQTRGGWQDPQLS